MSIEFVYPTEKLDREKTFDEVFDALLELKDSLKKLKALPEVDVEKITALEAKIEEVDEELSTIRN